MKRAKKRENKPNVHLVKVAASILKTKAINIRTLEQREQKKNKRNNERYQAKIKTSCDALYV